MGGRCDSIWLIKVDAYNYYFRHFGILGIRQNIIRQFLVWTVLPKFSLSKILYSTVYEDSTAEQKLKVASYIFLAKQ